MSSTPDEFKRMLNYAVMVNMPVPSVCCLAGAFVEQHPEEAREFFVTSERDGIKHIMFAAELYVKSVKDEIEHIESHMAQFVDFAGELTDAEREHMRAQANENDDESEAIEIPIGSPMY